MGYAGPCIAIAWRVIVWSASFLKSYKVEHSFTYCGLVTPYGVIDDKIRINIGSGNGLLPDSTTPLPQPMLTSHWWSSVAFTGEQFHIYHAQAAILYNELGNRTFEINTTFSRVQWVKLMKDTPYLILVVDLWGVYCENLVRNWLWRKGTN